MDIYNLIEKNEKKGEYREELFNKILKQCHRRIEYVAKSGEHHALFQVPVYIFGYPLFNRLQCCDFLLTSLKQNGFEVMSDSEFNIFISWEHIYREYVGEKREGHLLEYTDSRPPVQRIEDNLKRSNNLIFNKGSPFSILK